MVHVYEENCPFAYTMCRAEKFTDSTKICEKNDAPESPGTPPPACVGMCQLKPHGGDGGQYLTLNGKNCMGLLESVWRPLPPQGDTYFRSIVGGTVCITAPSPPPSPPSPPSSPSPPPPPPPTPCTVDGTCPPPPPPPAGVIGGGPIEAPAPNYGTSDSKRRRNLQNDIPEGRRKLQSFETYDACTCSPYDDAGARRLLAHVQEEPEEPFEQGWSWLKTMVQKTADWIINALSVKRVTWRQKNVDVNLVQCELNNILCKSHGLGVSNAVEIMTLAAFAYLLAFQLMGAASLGLVSLAMTLPVSIFVFFALSHGVSPWCFPASIPVCLFDDVTDISEDTFAKHIA
jgi:hypothetical protein